MAHVPARSLDLINPVDLREAIRRKAHDLYQIDGDDMNKLSCLAFRLEKPVPFDEDERRGWFVIINYLIMDAERRGQA